MKNRIIKVSQSSYCVKKTDSIIAGDHRYIYIPQLRFQGKWLSECGFLPGDLVHVQCEKNKLIITKE